MPKNIGANESQASESFKQRTALKPPYSASSCPEIGRKYQWAELKSSLLMKYLVHDPHVQQELVTWLQNLITHLFKFLEVDLRTEFEKYLKEVPTSAQKDKVESYPVGQVKAWTADAVGAWNNFYVLFNFIKWVWFKLILQNYYDPSECQKKPLYVFLIIALFQQKILVFHDMLRGDRLDLKGGTGGPPTDQIGITNLNIDFLRRKVRGKPAYVPQAWDHPGQVQCRVPYRGKYGTYIKEYRAEDSYYASLQCGISGSVQYILFMYLLSLFGTSGTDNPDLDVRNILTSACLILTGDGGHNIREVLFGFTCSIILMHTFLGRLEIEVKEYQKTGTQGRLLLTIREYIAYNLLKIPCAKDTDEKVNEEIFQNLLNEIGTKWYPFIQAGYQFTKDINIVGVYTSDLNAFNPTILQNPAASLTSAKDWFFDTIFSQENWIWLIHHPDSYNHVQIFFALEGNRYRLEPKESFKRIANLKMKFLVENFPNSARSDILKKVNDYMLKTLEFCESNKVIDPSLMKKIGRDPKNIPLAFPSRSKCAACSSHTDVMIENPDKKQEGYCIDCAADELKQSAMMEAEQPETLWPLQAQQVAIPNIREFTEEADCKSFIQALTPAQVDVIPWGRITKRFNPPGWNLDRVEQRIIERHWAKLHAASIDGNLTDYAPFDANPNPTVCKGGNGTVHTGCAEYYNKCKWLDHISSKSQNPGKEINTILKNHWKSVILWHKELQCPSLRRAREIAGRIKDAKKRLAALNLREQQERERLASTR